MNTNDTMITNSTTRTSSASSAHPQRSRRIRNRNFKRVASVACVMSTTAGWSQSSPSCVSAFHQGQSLTFSTIKTTTTNPSQHQHHAHDRFKVRNLRPTLTELCYRDDPDFKSTSSDASSAAVNNHLTDETKEQLGQAAAPSSTSDPSSAAASVEESSALASPPPSSNKNQLSNVFHTWWTAPKTRRAHQIAREQRRKRSDQVDLDAYLESIDKRYKRLHGREHRSSRAQKQQQQQQQTRSGGGYSNALSWLLATEDSSSEAAEQRRQEDGIYVLGLAGLASDRLLQKHHLPKPKNNNKGGTTARYQEKSRVIDISSQQVVVPSTTTTRATTTTITSPSLSLLYSMKHIQTAMNAVSLHTRNYFLESLRSTGKIMATMPSVINTAIGGKWAKQAVMALLTAMFALATTFRPFSKA